MQKLVVILGTNASGKSELGIRLANHLGGEVVSATPDQIHLANHPVGSGAIESTCRQYQCRFKRTGQFWTTPGDEALLCLETFWRNGRWQELYPHVKSSAALN